MLKSNFVFNTTSDWRELAFQRWQCIPFTWKKAFFLALLVNIVVYFFDLAQFPLGDHDIGYQDGIPLLSGGRSGRWFAPALQMMSGFVQIPVYTQLLAFTTQIAASMAAVLLWKPKADWFVLFAGALIISCSPAVSEFYYYHFSALTFVAAQLFMVLSLHTALFPRKRLFHYALSISLVTCALASYQSSVMTWTTCFWGILLIKISEWDGRADTLRALLFYLSLPFLCFAIGCVLYSVSLSLYPLVGLSLELYQFQTVTPTTFIVRLFETAYQAWLHLFTPQGFMSLWLKTLFLAAMTGGTAVLLRFATLKKSFSTRRVAAIIVGFLLFPLTAKSQFLLSSYNEWYAYRFLGMGVSYMYCFFFVILLAASTMAARNAGLVLFVFILPCMAVNNLDQQIRHVRSVDHDMAVLNRVVGRIEALENFDPDKTYNLVQFGRTTPYLRDSPGVGPHSPLEHTTVSQAWNPGFELWLLSKYLKLGDRINESVTKRPDIMVKALQYAADKKPFPHPGSVGIIDDTIVLLFDRTAISQAEAQVQEWNKQKL